MGWFEEQDYKRMLLVFDEILYLLPQHLAEFTDVTGERQFIAFPLSLRESAAFRVHHLVPDERVRALILAAAQADLAAQPFVAAARAIPGEDQLYTWRIANADGDLDPNGASPALEPGAAPYAHARLLNKFLWAAGEAQCVPISGRRHIHELLYAKLRHAAAPLPAGAASLSPVLPQGAALRHAQVVERVVRALVPDDALAKRSLGEIAEFKRRHHALFERFSLAMRRTVSQVQSLPMDAGFDREVEELLRTDVWEAARDLEEEITDAWWAAFRSGLKAVAGKLKKDLGKVAGAVSLGVVPISLQGLTLASVAAAGLPVAGWAAGELLEALDGHVKRQRNGLYYLMRFRQ